MRGRPETLAPAVIAVSLTAQRLNVASPYPITSLLLWADTSNVGAVYLGDSSVTISSGFPLNPGTTIAITSDMFPNLSGIDLELNDFFIVSATTGNAVRMFLIRRKS